MSERRQIRTPHSFVMNFGVFKFSVGRQSQGSNMNHDERETSITLVEFDCPKNQPRKLVFNLVGYGHHCGTLTVYIDQHYSKGVSRK